jgi:hypothetical protein
VVHDGRGHGWRSHRWGRHRRRDHGRRGDRCLRYRRRRRGLRGHRLHRLRGDRRLGHRRRRYGLRGHRRLGHSGVGYRWGGHRWGGHGRRGHGWHGRGGQLRHGLGDIRHGYGRRADGRRARGSRELLCRGRWNPRRGNRRGGRCRRCRSQQPVLGRHAAANLDRHECTGRRQPWLSLQGRRAVTRIAVQDSIGTEWIHRPSPHRWVVQVCAGYRCPGYRARRCAALVRHLCRARRALKIRRGPEGAGFAWGARCARTRCANADGGRGPGEATYESAGRRLGAAHRHTDPYEYGHATQPPAAIAAAPWRATGAGPVTAAAPMASARPNVAG